METVEIKNKIQSHQTALDFIMQLFILIFLPENRTQTVRT